MRERTTTIAVTICGLTALGLLRYRRRFLSRLLGLPPALYDVVVERGLRVPMPDGAELVADRYHPRSPDRFPTVLVRTPYGRKNLDRPLVMRLLAERGYNAVIQDVRGRFDSDGEFGFLAGEAADGRATMGWISGQPWFDGALGLWGESYLGYAQWAAAPGAPSYLKAMMPGITASRFYSVIHPDAAFGLDVALPVSVLLGAQEAGSNVRLVRNVILPLRIRRGFLRLPVGEADLEAAGRPLVRFREWLSHPEPDASYWRERDRRHRVREVEAEVHLFGGWHDIFLRQLLGDYASLVGAGKDPYLTVGPYPHGSVRMFVDLQRQTFAWFGLHLKGETAKAREKPVRLYVMGSGEWRDFDAWPPPAEEHRYHLHPGGDLSPRAPPADAPPGRYRYDPADPTPAAGGPLFSHSSGRRGAVDNRKLESRPDVLVYTTPPLTSALEVIGPVRLELYARSSLEHADFFGRLCDVRPSGKSVNVCDGLFRLTPGKKGEPRPDGSSRIEIDMWATAYRFRRGHRVRLQVSSGAHPRWNRNLGAGEPIATATTMRVAEQAVYHDLEHPSAVVLPVTVSAS
jgi:putative CocE/NonD family hydrolase